LTNSKNFALPWFQKEWRNFSATVF